MANGVVYVNPGDPNGSIYALNANTGAKLWSYTNGKSCAILAHHCRWGGVPQCGRRYWTK